MRDYVVNILPALNDVHNKELIEYIERLYSIHKKFLENFTKELSELLKELESINDNDNTI